MPPLSRWCVRAALAYLVLGMGVARDANPAPAAMTVDYVRVWSDTTSG